MAFSLPDSIPNSGSHSSNTAATQDILRLSFDALATGNTLAGPPVLEAWETSSPSLTMGTLGDASSQAGRDTKFSGLTGPTGTATNSCVYAFPLEETTPGSAEWAQALTDTDGTYLAASTFGTNVPANAGEVTGKAIAGSDSYLQLVSTAYDGLNPGASWSDLAGWSARFNIAYRLGASSSTTASDHNFILACRYIYTGASNPEPKWEGYDGAAWNDMAGPSITALKIIHANNSALDSNPVITKPGTGYVFSGKLVVDTA